MLEQSYSLICNYYGDKTTDRSGVRLMNHIDEGLVILKLLNADEATQAAYCIHPIYQSNSDLLLNHSSINSENISPLVVLLSMEYRHIANGFLSDKIHLNFHEYDFKLSPLLQVNQMLVADKIQNAKDFYKYHINTHSRSRELALYFSLWFQKLGIDKSTYDSFVDIIETNAV